jgi:hypothetical protein
MSCPGRQFSVFKVQFSFVRDWYDVLDCCGIMMCCNDIPSCRTCVIMLNVSVLLTVLSSALFILLISGLVDLT